ncbi:MAG: extracellular solute-binding protein, partial [Chloroflexi bacterium]|nr:extracellular solute-binding protein [Chloroflexota bacterium]
MSYKSIRRSLSRREFLRGAAVLAGGSLLAACGAQQTPAPQASTQEAAPATTTESGQAAGSGKKKIVIWGWPAADKAYESFLADFKTDHPDIETDIQMVGTSPEEHNKLLTALAAGTGAPDVGMIEINFIDKFVVKGGLEDLLAAPYNAGKYQQDMVEYKWKQGTTPDGRLVAFPWDIGPATFFYRRDLFEEAGLPSDPEEVGQLTKTWPGFLDVCKKLTDPTKQRWAISSAADIVYTEYAHRNFFDKDWNVIVDKGRPVELLQIALEARKAGIDAKVANWTPEWQALLGQGAIAIQYGGCWMGGFLKTW